MIERASYGIGSAPSKRGAVRHKLFEPVTLRAAGIGTRAHLLDLSRSGSLAHAERPPRQGETVKLEIADISLWARVIWVRGKRFGLHFSHLLPAELVDRIVGRA